MTPRDRRPGGTRDRILGAAKELFGRDGFDTTTVKEVAERVGLTDAALYYHFRNKREILEAIWEMPVGGGPAQLRADEPLTPARLREIVESTLEFTVRNCDFLRLVLREVLAGDETAMALRLRNRSVLRRTFSEHLCTRFDSSDAEVRAEAILMVVTGSSLKLQIESGSGFEEAANAPAYREQLHRKVQQLAGLEPALAS